MPLIPEETLQEVLAATDIVDLVGRYVKLRRVGTRFVGLCPFHQEKTPSFNVDPHTRHYHCFGCGAGGTAIRFLMEHENLQFPEAVRRLAEAAGIRIEEEVFDANADQRARERRAVVKVHAELADWYHSLLMKHPIAEAARDYLKSRGLSAEAAKGWKMGYAPAAGDMLRTWAESQKFTEGLLIFSGILARGDEESGRGGQTYPRFRHRLMFPIRNDQGEIIAFTGRVLDPNAKAAKYLNSPETILFSKSKVLFGFDKARRAILKEGRAIICEGQIDMITAYEAGFQNIVASQGTAFTDFHARSLKRHTEEVVLCFDSDLAGYKAAERAFETLAPTGLVVKVAPLPEGEDPDSLIRHHGPEAFRHQLSLAQDFFAHMVDSAYKHRKMAETREKTRFSAEMAEKIRLLDSNIARDAAIQLISRRLGIPEAEYRRQVARVAKPRTGEQTGSGSVPVLPQQNQHATQLIRAALQSREALNSIRTANRENLAAVSGCELLQAVCASQIDISSGEGWATFMSTLSEVEERAFSAEQGDPQHVASMKKQQIDLAMVQVTLESLEIQGLRNMLENAQTQLKNPALDHPSTLALFARVASLKESLDRRTRPQNIPSLPPPP